MRSRGIEVLMDDVRVLNSAGSNFGGTPAKLACLADDLVRELDDLLSYSGECAGKLPPLESIDYLFGDPYNVMDAMDAVIDMFDLHSTPHDEDVTPNGLVKLLAQKRNEKAS